MAPSLSSEDRTRFYVVAIGLLIGIRFIAAAFLPLFFGDELYYWMWSKHLAWGYYDHPPAIAALIRAGTALFGDTEFGVRFFGLALTVPTTMCVWRTGTLLLGGSEHGARAALYFNLMLMVHAVSFLAAPDAPMLACSAAFIWSIAEAEARADGRWWLAAGLFAGLGLLSKYIVLFLGLGVFLWLVLTGNGRRWLATPWPWLGGAIAALVFSPHVIWNASNDWVSLGFQFGRLGFSGRGRWYYLPQFVGEQLVIASPFILILAMIGLWRAALSGDSNRILIAALCWPIILFCFGYVFVDRIHRNWIDVIYPALALAAADAWRRQYGTAFIRRAAVPTAVALLVIIYGQALFRPFSLAPYDQLNHHLASTMRQVAVPIARAVEMTQARGILTTDFPITSWLHFYLRPQVPIIMVADEFRFLTAPPATAQHLDGTLIYVALKTDMLPVLTGRFSRVERLEGLPPTPFLVYRVSGFKGEPYGRIP